MDFDFDLALDLDGLLNRASLDKWCLVQVQVEDQVQVRPIWCHAELSFFPEEVSGETLRLKASKKHPPVF